MAGSEIFIGEMIDSLKQDLASVVSTLQAHTTALGNINTTVAQGVNSINIKASDGPMVGILNTADVMAPTNASYVRQFGIKSFASGTFKFKARLKLNTVNDIGGSYVYIAYRVNNGSWIEIGSLSGGKELPGLTAEKDVTATITVKQDDIVDIGLYFGTGQSGSPSGRLLAGSTASYELIDILNGGGLVSFV